jgi:hypothetical protein
MKIPVRPAPLPPSSKQDMNLQHSTSALDGWGDGYVLHPSFIMQCMLKIQSEHKLYVYVRS